MDISEFLYTPVFFLCLYLVIINLYGFIVMGVDKWKSSRKKWRVPEKSIFLTAFIGGALGVFLGMKKFHHKTLHNKFKFGIPALLVLNIIIIILVFHL